MIWNVFLHLCPIGCHTNSSRCGMITQSTFELSSENSTLNLCILVLKRVASTSRTSRMVNWINTNILTEFNLLTKIPKEDKYQILKEPECFYSECSYTSMECSESFRALNFGINILFSIWISNVDIAYGNGNQSKQFIRLQRGHIPMKIQRQIFTYLPSTNVKRLLFYIISLISIVFKLFTKKHIRNGELIQNFFSIFEYLTSSELQRMNQPKCHFEIRLLSERRSAEEQSYFSQWLSNGRMEEKYKLIWFICRFLLFSMKSCFLI